MTTNRTEIIEMKQRITTLLPLNWSELDFKEKKEYLLMIKKAVK